MARESTEVRIQFPCDELAVIDGHCSATGQDRTTVIRQIVGEWARKEHHRAIVICRVAGDKPARSESER